jgi:hypothetical protein
MLLGIVPSARFHPTSVFDFASSVKFNSPYIAILSTKELGNVVLTEITTRGCKFPEVGPAGLCSCVLSRAIFQGGGSGVD